MHNLRWLILILTALSVQLILFGQGCQPVNFTSIVPQAPTSLLHSNVAGNGGTYDGKLIGMHFVPGFTCEGKAAPKSTIVRELDNKWYYSESDKLRCNRISNQLIANGQVEINGNFNTANYQEKLYYLNPSRTTAEISCLGPEATRLPYAAGSGTAEAPYLICSTTQLYQLSKATTDWNKIFKVMADLDLSNFPVNSITPIGNSTTPFTGAFDGNGHVIYNFFYQNPNVDNVGLFGKVFRGRLENIILVNPQVSGKSAVGSLLGLMEAGRSYASYSIGGKVSGNTSVGGLIGVFQDQSYLGAAGAETDVEELPSISPLAARIRFGGLVGHAYDSIVQSGFATGRVTGSSSVGGLIGDFSSMNSGQASISFSTGAVSGIENVGGFIGLMQKGMLYYCYSTSDVMVRPDPLSRGGQSTFAGSVSNGYIVRVYASGELFGGYMPGASGGIAGQFVGPVAADSNIFNSYYSSLVTGTNGVQVSSSAIRQQATFNGWNFTLNSAYAWEIQEGISPPSFSKIR